MIVEFSSPVCERVYVKRILTDLALSSSSGAPDGICLNSSSEPSKSIIWSSSSSATVTSPATVHSLCKPLMSVKAACGACSRCSTGAPTAMVSEQQSSGRAPVASVPAL